MQVPNLFPVNWGHQKIALIGEAPGADEDKCGKPFVGVSGQHLDKLLALASCPSRREVYLGNVTQHRPLANDISKFHWDGPEIRTGLEQLRYDMCKLKPNIVVLLGNIPLKAARDCSRIHPLNAKAFSYKISKWRGSLFICTDPLSPFYNLKCMATYHPAYTLRDYKTNVIARLDLIRARIESQFPTLDLPKRNISILIYADEVAHRLRNFRTNKSKVSLDIEGGLGTMSCISFAVSPYEVYVIPFYVKTGEYVWGQEEGVRVFRELAGLLEDENCEKILQMSLYDRFVLQYGYRIRMARVTHDTLLSGWEIYSQLPKGLAFQGSIWTREPFYKNERLQVEEEE